MTTGDKYGDTVSLEGVGHDHSTSVGGSPAGGASASRASVVATPGRTRAGRQGKRIWLGSASPPKPAAHGQGLGARRSRTRRLLQIAVGTGLRHTGAGSVRRTATLSLVGIGPRLGGGRKHTHP